MARKLEEDERKRKANEPVEMESEKVEDQVKMDEEMVVEAEEAKVVAVRDVAKVEEVVRTEVVVVVRQVRGKERGRRARTRVRFTRGTRRPGTRTCRHSKPAPAIGFLGRLLIFVKNQAPVHGKIFGFQRVLTK